MIKLILLRNAFQMACPSLHLTGMASEVFGVQTHLSTYVTLSQIESSNIKI